MKPEELNKIANAVNGIREEKSRKVKDIVNEILYLAKQRACKGEYTLNVDKWCGDYVPLSGEVVKELEQLGYTVYTGSAYSYYIQWRYK